MLTKNSDTGEIKKKKRVWIPITLIIVTAAYLVVAFSSIPIVAKYRTIYIETAMSTMTHQWLATAFFPKSVVNDVMEKVAEQQEQNIVDKNEVIAEERKELFKEAPKIDPELKAKREFMYEYSEIDMNTLPENVKYEGLVLDETAGVMTVHGDEVYLLDTVNEIIILNVEGTGYKGKLVIAKDASRVKLAESSKAHVGEFVNTIVTREGLVGINASGFMDNEGKGNGGTPVGLVKVNGEVKNNVINQGYWFIIGFDYDNNLHIGTQVDVDTLRDAVQFRPALIIDGEKKVEGSYGWGIQPRSAIGQTADQDVLLLVIDGRRPEHSIGATVGDCADIMLRYGAIQAANLDGGSSSALSYNGETINIPSTSSGNKDGRYVPNAWVITGIEEVEQDIGG